jgi:hypothetical protein
VEQTARDEDGRAKAVRLREPDAPVVENDATLRCRSRGK